MSIRKSVASITTAGSFKLSTGTSGQTTFDLSQIQPPGTYAIDSANSDATLEFYLIDPDGSPAGNSTASTITASAPFNSIVVYGAGNNDTISFELADVVASSANGDKDSGAAPFITSISVSDLPNLDDTLTITGGNFATNVTVTFTGTDNVTLDAKSIVRNSSTELLVTRPDAAIEDNAPFTMTVTNPGIPSSAIRTFTQSVTVGGDPVWNTDAGSLPDAEPDVAYSQTLSATDPDGGTITYAIVSGSLPTGLSFNTSTGEISGTPTLEETQSFTVSATDLSGNVTNRSFDLTIAPALVVEYLIIAGGGGGGGAKVGAFVGGSGGGAGGYRSSVSGESSGGGASAESALNLDLSTNYTVTVGAGGGGGIGNASGTSGSNSVFASITSIGGGEGVSQNLNGVNGGSGGGAGLAGSGTFSGGSGTINQGFAGGDNSANGSDFADGGGGGGASQGGGDGGIVKNSFGGDGVSSSITGSATFRAGGGAGGINKPGGSGGGASSPSAISNGNNGVSNTGGGGSGAVSANETIRNGGSGGSGIVILRYPSDKTITIGAGLTGTETTVGANKVATITAGTGNISWS